LPNKTIYIADPDLVAWDRAAQDATLTGRSMSQLIAQLITDHVTAADPSTVQFTAEVFMARIGPRLLTRALVEQLDYVPDRDCEPFGRIKPRAGDIDVHVLGRHTTDGSLVKAKRNRPEPARSRTATKRREFDEYLALPLILLAD
jgi:hypothetical protein